MADREPCEEVVELFALLREECKMTTILFAKLIGATQQKVSRWLQGEYQPSAEIRTFFRMLIVLQRRGHNIKHLLADACPGMSLDDVEQALGAEDLGGFEVEDEDDCIEVEAISEKPLSAARPRRARGTAPNDELDSMFQSHATPVVKKGPSPRPGRPKSRGPGGSGTRPAGPGARGPRRPTGPGGTPPGPRPASSVGPARGKGRPPAGVGVPSAGKRRPTGAGVPPMGKRRPTGAGGPPTGRRRPTGGPPPSRSSRSGPRPAKG